MHSQGAREADLDWFVEAQDAVIDQVTAELRAGRKRTHWMWFIFPQIAGLGRSPTAQYFAIRDLDEAKRYLADPLLGSRLRCHVQLMLEHKTASASAILGSPDDLKFCSSLTLFHSAASTPLDQALFTEALKQFYDGKLDARTLEILGMK